MAAMESPGALAGATGARVSANATAGEPENKRKPRKGATLVRVHGEEGRRDRLVTLSGRFAWTLRKLMDAGERGITASDLPAGVRLSHYIFRLRGDGFSIETVHEEHGGEFSGRHALYVLRSRVTVEAEARRQELVGGVDA